MEVAARAKRSDRWCCGRCTQLPFLAGGARFAPGEAVCSWAVGLAGCRTLGIWKHQVLWWSHWFPLFEVSSWSVLALWACRFQQTEVCGLACALLSSKPVWRSMFSPQPPHMHFVARRIDAVCVLMCLDGQAMAQSSSVCSVCEFTPVACVLNGVRWGSWTSGPGVLPSRTSEVN